MFDVVCVGSATQDVFVKSDLSKIVRISDALTQKELLCYDYGSKVTVDNIDFLTGGGATNTAVSFARLGLKAAFLGKVGKDDAANNVLGELKKEGVDVAYGVSSSSLATGYSVILISFEGDRTVLTFRGANDTLDETDIDWALFDNTKWVYMSSLSGRSAQIAQTMALRAKDKGVKLAFNPGSTQLKTRIKGLAPILQCTDVLIMNREEAEMVTGVTATRKGVDQERCALCGDCVKACDHGVLALAGGRLAVQGVDLCAQCGKCVKACPRGAMSLEPWAYNLFEIFRIFMESGVKVAVITDGRLGSQACDGRSVYVFPAYAAPTVDTLGAGDAFASAFVAELATSGDVCKALQMGAANSSSVVRYFGAKPGLLSLAEAREFIAGKAGHDIYFVRKVPFGQLVAK
jgi:ribokinase